MPNEHRNRPYPKELIDCEIDRYETLEDVVLAWAVEMNDVDELDRGLGELTEKLADFLYITTDPENPIKRIMFVSINNQEIVDRENTPPTVFSIETIIDNRYKMSWVLVTQSDWGSSQVDRYCLASVTNLFLETAKLVIEKGDKSSCHRAAYEKYHDGWNRIDFNWSWRPGICKYEYMRRDITDAEADEARIYQFVEELRRQNRVVTLDTDLKRSLARLGQKGKGDVDLHQPVDASQLRGWIDRHTEVEIDLGDQDGVVYGFNCTKFDIFSAQMVLFVEDDPTSWRVVSKSNQTDQEILKQLFIQL